MGGGTCVRAVNQPQCGLRLLQLIGGSIVGRVECRSRSGLIRRLGRLVGISANADTSLRIGTIIKSIGVSTRQHMGLNTPPYTELSYSLTKSIAPEHTPPINQRLVYIKCYHQ